MHGSLFVRDRMVHRVCPNGCLDRSGAHWGAAGNVALVPRVPAHQTQPVLLADLGPVAGAGMTGLLSEHGMEVVSAAGGADLGETVSRVQPYAVVLDLDGDHPRALTQLVREACPATKVVLWARAEDVMEVLDPGATAPRFVLGSSPAELCEELVVTQPRPEAPEDPQCPTT